jgi:hypothetical protein
LSRVEQEYVWTKWVEGASLEAICGGLAASAGGIYGVVRRAGGVVPVPRHRAPITLSDTERHVIARGVADQDPVREIARRLRRAPSTMSREIARNGERTAQTRHYEATVADDRAWRRA